jgi:hypothetical protein
MKRNFVILSITLILTGLLGFASISLAQRGQWKEKADMPTFRRDLAASAVNGMIYAFGGHNGNERLTTVEIYNPAADTWKKGADMSAPRSQFPTATDTWEKGKKMPTIRESLATVQVKGKIYAIGGWGPGGKLLATVEEFTPDGWPFAVSPQGKLATTWGGIKAMN